MRTTAIPGEPEGGAAPSEREHSIRKMYAERGDDR